MCYPQSAILALTFTATFTITLGLLWSWISIPLQASMGVTDDRMTTIIGRTLPGGPR